MKVSINPQLLAWAIADAGISRSTVAKKVEIAPAVLDEWLAKRLPVEVLLGQVRKLSTVLQRTMSFFFLPEPPAADLSKVAFRTAPDQKDAAPSPETRTALRETQSMQEFLAWLTRELQLGTAHLPQIGKSVQPHVAADLMRKAADVSIDTQLRWKDETAALREWRSALESLGVSVFLTSVADGPKGFSISSPWNPVIVVNTHTWNAGARIFTLAHEIGHLLRGSDSSCMAIGSSADPEERWCDRFAAAFLMPWEAVTRVLAKGLGWDGHARIDDLDVARRLAAKFKVSLSAAVLRLVHEDVAPGSLFAKIPVASNLPSGGGRGDPEKSRRPYRRLQQFGRRTASLLNRAVAQEIVTKHEALSRLGCNYDEFDQIVAQADVS